jgi:hypothetical protein
VNTADSNILYLFNRTEAREPFYTYNNYKAGLTYSADDRAHLGGRIYKSLQNGNAGNDPVSSPLYWVFENNITYLFNRSESGSTSQFDFIIYVPSSILSSVDWVEDKARALVDQYRMSNKTYTFAPF